MIKALMQKNRRQLDTDLTNIDKRKYFSPAIYIFTQKLLKSLDKYAHGRLIDIGCGDTPYLKYILNDEFKTPLNNLKQTNAKLKAR